MHYLQQAALGLIWFQFIQFNYRRFNSENGLEVCLQWNPNNILSRIFMQYNFMHNKSLEKLWPTKTHFNLCTYSLCEFLHISTCHSETVWFPLIYNDLFHLQNPCSLLQRVRSKVCGWYSAIVVCKLIWTLKQFYVYYAFKTP